MTTPRSQNRLTWILILSVFALALAWGEHQLERLDPAHSEVHCQLCYHLEKLATAITCSALITALLSGAVSAIKSHYRYQNVDAVTASARSPPSMKLTVRNL
ncbi:hypothetical protein ACVFI8_10095 [Agarivorans sp. MS3-6]|uniref:hypothetical protein n=1 Tax=Agarivorans sp. TSD2052 TaxID=2937286 RepID=UPI00200DE608|nr:hypothetical protein [Agarivorans sp. TSD2052]UPW18526.1 hypothetical protein M0C34_20280 [Agarivorans sp. TSD2052]